VEAHITLNEKCEFSKTEIKFAGHVISSAGIKPDPDKVSAIIKMAAPTNVSELRCFLGMVNQMSKFCNDLAQLAAPLYALLAKDNAWTWEAMQQICFADVKQSITSAPVLALYDANKPIIICADSSSYGLGAVLKQQQSDGSWRPVFYASRSLSEVERRYAQVEKEGLAVTWSCERFAEFITGTRFVIHTDHKPLITLFSASKTLDSIPPRLQRFRIRLMRFDFSIVYVPGKQLNTADALSRFPQPVTPSANESAQVVEQFVDMVTGSLPLTDTVLKDIKLATSADPTLRDVITYSQSTWPEKHTLPVKLQAFWHSCDCITVKDDILLLDSRIIIPEALRQRVSAALHAGHLGIDKCRQKARTAVWWPKISQDIEQYVKACPVCSHLQHEVREPLLPSELPDIPWQKVATDLFMLNDKIYLLVVDYFSRYIEVLQLKSQTAEAVINALKAIFARHGITMVCISDNGPCYAAEAFKDSVKNYGITHVTSSPRYAQANGAAERAVQTVKALLRKANDPYLALLSYRTTPVFNGLSPAQLLMGRQLRSTVPTITSKLAPKAPDVTACASADRLSKQQQKANYDRRHRARVLQPFAVGESVWVKDLRCEARVTRIMPNRTYIVLTSAGSSIRRNRTLLRTARPTPPHHDTLFCDDNIASHPSRCVLRETPPLQARDHRHSAAGQHQPNAPYVTRSGRTVKPPQRLDI
jgi:transposase InsO family protein